MWFNKGKGPWQRCALYWVLFISWALHSLHTVHLTTMLEFNMNYYPGFKFDVEHEKPGYDSCSLLQVELNRKYRMHDILTQLSVGDIRLHQLPDSVPEKHPAAGPLRGLPHHLQPPDAGEFMIRIFTDVDADCRYGAVWGSQRKSVTLADVRHTRGKWEHSVPLFRRFMDGWCPRKSHKCVFWKVETVKCTHNGCW